MITLCVRFVCGYCLARTAVEDWYVGWVPILMLLWGAVLLLGVVKDVLLFLILMKDPPQIE